MPGDGVRITTPPGGTGSATPCSSIVVLVNRLEPPLARRYLLLCDAQRRIHGYLTRGVFRRLVLDAQASLLGNGLL
jgi:hypothetical protein